MPKNLTETATFSATVTVPEDGDGVTGLSIETAAQSLANRSQYLKSIVTGTGVGRIREVTTLAALKALTGMVDTDVVRLYGAGLYRYDTSTSATENLPWIVAPDVGSGRWIHDNNALAGSVLATLDSGGKVVEPVPMRTFALEHKRFGALTIVTSTAFAAAWTTNAPSAVISVSCQATDIIEIDAAFLLSASGAGTVKGAIGIDTGSVTILDETIREVTGTTPTYVQMTTTLLAGSAGTKSIGLYAYPSATYDATIAGPASFRVRVTRP